MATRHDSCEEAPGSAIPYPVAGEQQQVRGSILRIYRVLARKRAA